MNFFEWLRPNGTGDEINLDHPYGKVLQLRARAMRKAVESGETYTLRYYSENGAEDKRPIFDSSLIGALHACAGGLIGLVEAAKLFGGEAKFRKLIESRLHDLDGQDNRGVNWERDSLRSLWHTEMGDNGQQPDKK